MTMFKSYKEAHERLGLEGSYQTGTIGDETNGLSSLKITDHVGSYDRITMNGKFVYYVGRGVKPSPGHPGANQLFHKQKLFYRSMELQNEFPILHKLKKGGVELLGRYTTKDVRKRVSDEGFSYFEVKLARVSRPHESE